MKNNYLLLPPLVERRKDDDEPSNDNDNAPALASDDEPPGIPVHVFIVMLILGGVLASLLTGGVQIVGLEPTQTTEYQILSSRSVMMPATVLPTDKSVDEPVRLTSTPASTVTPTPTPSPYGDENGNPAPAPEMYPWADYEWRNYASHIVAGEAPNSEEGRRVVACTLIRDVLLGWNPNTLTTRWFGWKEPDWDDRMSVWDALQPGGCAGLPWYRYVGSTSDYYTWISKGMINRDDSYDVYGNLIAVE